MDPYCYRMSQFYTCIKVTNLSPTITAQELMNMFEDCGDIVSIRISRNFSGNKWAIINFGETEAVMKAELYSGTILDGRIINVYACFLGRNDFDYTEQFYFGRTLPLSKKEKEAIDKTLVHITSNGKTYLVHDNTHINEIVNNTVVDDGIDFDSYKIEVDHNDNSLHLKQVNQQEPMKEIEPLEIESINDIPVETIPDTTTLDEDELRAIDIELELLRLEEEFLDREEYDYNFELMKQDMNILDRGYLEVPFITRQK